MADVRTFEFTVPEDTDPQALIGLARKRAREAQITLEGDEVGGSFEGAASGSYRVDGRTVHVEVSKKPAFVPWSMIEAGLRRAFG